MRSDKFSDGLKAALPEVFNVVGQTASILISIAAAIAMMSLLPAASAATGYIRGDANGDGKVDIADAVSVLNLMAEGIDNPAADLNADGKVDIADFVTVLNLMAEQ